MKTERYECYQLIDPDKPAGSKVKRKPPHDWRRWPKYYRKQADDAVKQQMAKLPKGSKIISQRSRCDVRVDLSGLPWQLFREIQVRIPA